MHYEWVSSPTHICEYSETEQAADKANVKCPIHQAPTGLYGQTALDEVTNNRLNDVIASS